MTKKAHLVKASVLNGHSAESSGALLFVYASPTPSVDKDAVMSAYSCGKCSTQFAALAKTEPFCITCGAEDVYEDEDQDLDVEEFEDADEELASIPCGDCNTKNIVKLTTANVLGAQVHCVTCGSSINFQAPALAGAEEEYDDLEDAEDMDVDTNDALHDSFEDTLDEGDDFTGTEDLDESEEVSSEDDAESDDPFDAEDLPEDDDDTEVAETEEDDAADDEAEDEDFEEETLASLIGTGTLSIERVGDVLVASVNNLPIATLAQEDAGTYANVFHGAEFASAIRHTVKQQGISKGLATYNFAFAKAKLPVGRIVKRRVARKVESKLLRVEAANATYSDDFEQAFGIALAAMNKGFFKGESNPLKEGFIQALTTANVRNPSKLVDNVFRSFGNEMARTAFDRTKKLLGQSAEVRNEIAEAVMDTNYQETEEVDLDDQEDNDDLSLESRLEGAGLRQAGRKAETATVKPRTIATAEVASVIDKARKLGNGSIFNRK